MKKIISIILTLSLLFAFGCQNQHEETKPLSKEEETAIHTLVLQSVNDILEANDFASDALECHLEDDLESEIEYYYDAIDSLKTALEEVDSFTSSSDNHLCTAIKLLILEYQETIAATEKYLEDFNTETAGNYQELVNMSTDAHFRLIDYSQAFANLYAIRQFDRFSDSEAKQNLETYWPDFNFVEPDQFFPENLEEFDKKDLFMMWAKQFNEDFTETNDFNRDLERLRQEAELSPEANGRWLDFCRKYIFNTEYDDEIDQSYKELSKKNVL